MFYKGVARSLDYSSHRFGTCSLDAKRRSMGASKIRGPLVGVHITRTTEF